MYSKCFRKKRKKCITICFRTKLHSSTYSFSSTRYNPKNYYLIIYQPINKSQHQFNSVTCDEGWELFGEKCFYFGGTERLNFTTAEDMCHSLNPTAHLASVLSKEELDWILGWTTVNTFTYSCFYLSLHNYTITYIYSICV